VRRALLAAVFCLAGCGGSQRAPAVVPAATSAAAGTARIAGTDLSAQEVADAAAGVPVDGHVRPELVPLKASAFARPIARYRGYSAGQAAEMQARVSALTRALRAGDRTDARRGWAGAYEYNIRLGAA
jgi:hypothetical protein